MVGTNLKAESLEMVDKRGAIEDEINAIIQRLCQAGAPGLSGNLVDSEGFPRSDIDVHAVRADRHRLAELKNDHRGLTDKINQNIQLLHAAKPGSKSSSNLVSENYMDIDDQVSSSSAHASIGHVSMRSTAAGVDAIANIPFAMVDEIAESSPAAEDGLQLGDQIVKFGSVEAGENMLSKLASEVQANQGSSISVVVLRQGALSSVSVSPRAWQGRGLLGCHFKIL